MATELYWLERYLGNPPVAQEGDLIVDGFKVPHVWIRRSTDMSEDGNMTLCLSNLDFDTTEAEVKRWGHFLANAMAYAAGFTCFGAGNDSGRRRDSFFGSRVHTLGDLPDHSEEEPPA